MYGVSPNLLILDTHRSENLTSHKNLLYCVLGRLLLAASSVQALLLVISMEMTVSLCSQWHWGSLFRVLRSSTSLLFFCPRLSLSANFKFFCRRRLVKAAQSWPWLSTYCDIKAPSLLVVYSFDLLVVMEKTCIIVNCAIMNLFPLKIYRLLFKSWSNFAGLGAFLVVSIGLNILKESWFIESALSLPFFISWEKVHLWTIDSAEANSEKISTISCRYCGTPAT